MAIPATRTDFKKFVLRRLGHPYIKVRVTDEQLDDRIDEAVRVYVQRHYGGSEKVYLSHQLTAPEVAAKKITLDDSIIGVVGTFQIGFSAGGNVGTLNGMTWQMLLSDMVFNSSGSMSGGVADYVVMRTNLNVISEFMVGQFPIRYNENTDELFLDCDASKLVAGSYVVIEAYRKNDPADYPDVWADQWLQRYATELVRMQQGQNLATFSGVALPGGITVDGNSMIITAQKAIDELEQELVNTWSPISGDFIG